MIEVSQKIGVSLKLECHLYRNVTKIVMSLKKKMSLNVIITEIGMSIQWECH